MANQAPTETNPSWERVLLARHPKRPHTLDYIQRLFTNFEELHGDRAYGDDHAIVAGPAWFDDRPVMIIGQQKGRDTKQKLFRNFGMPKPEGYRKSLRLMELAAKFSRPVITFLDTMGAYPGYRCRGARPGRGHRAKPARDVASARPGDRRGDRRRRQRRSFGAGHRQSHLHARECHL